MKDRPPLANCYKVISPDGKVSYLFGTAHLLYKLPQEIQVLMEKKQIQYTYVERDFEKKDMNTPSIVRLDQCITLSSRSKNIAITQLDCLPGNQIQQIDYEVIHFAKDDLKAYFTPQLLLNQKREDYLGPSLVNNRYFVKKYDAIFSIKENVNDRARVGQRNQLWKSTILNAFQQGGALVAVGIAHVLPKSGYIDILQQNHFLLEPYECTIEINENEVKKLSTQLADPHGAMELAKEFEEKYSTELKQHLPKLMQKFHAKNLTYSQKSELNRILQFIFENEDNHIFFKSFLFFLVKIGINEVSVEAMLAHRVSSKSEFNQIELYIQSLFKHKLEPKSIGQHRQAIFLVCLFYPELAKKLYHHFQKISHDHAINLFISCGFNESVKAASLYEAKTFNFSSKNHFFQMQEKKVQQISIKAYESVNLKNASAITIQTHFRKYLKRKHETRESMVGRKIVTSIKAIPLTGFKR